MHVAVMTLECHRLEHPTTPSHAGGPPRPPQVSHWDRYQVLPLRLLFPLRKSLPRSGKPRSCLQSDMVTGRCRAAWLVPLSSLSPAPRLALLPCVSPADPSSPLPVTGSQRLLRGNSSPKSLPQLPLHSPTSTATWACLLGPPCQLRLAHPGSASAFSRGDDSFCDLQLYPLVLPVT